MKVTSTPAVFWEPLGTGTQIAHLLSPEFLAFPPPAVSSIDCTDCRKVKEGVASRGTKCCDVLPKLRNFQAGAVLTDASHPVLEAWIRQKRADPFAIHIPPALAQQYRLARSQTIAGRACPLLLPGDEARCSIYQYRPALCVGYHCYYPDSFQRELWSCLQHTLELWQDAVSRALVWRSDLDRFEMSRFWERWEGDLWEGEGHHPVPYTAFWQHWEGKELEFFRGCAASLSQWTQEDAVTVRELQGQHLLTRPGTDPEKSLDDLWKVISQPLRPSQPPESIRRRYREGDIPAAEEATYFLHEQESWSLWYLETQRDQSRRGWWKRFSIW